jgi:hypothetical protein
LLSPDTPMTEAQSVVPLVPHVYRQDGYLVLTLSTRAGEVHFISTREGGKSFDLDFPRFMRRMQVPNPIPNPYRLALNLLAQDKVGTLRLRARDKRKIFAMLQKSEEQLNELSLADLGREYARIVGKTPPPEQQKDVLIKELLMQIEESVAKEEKKEESGQPAASSTEATQQQAPQQSATAPAGEAPAVPTKPAETKKKTRKEVDKEIVDGLLAAGKATKEQKEMAAKKKDSTKKKPTTKPAKKATAKSAAKATPKKVEGKKKTSDGNPFREGSMKAKAFDVFKKNGGDRAKTIEATVKLGSTESTAKSWYAVFCKV